MSVNYAEITELKISENRPKPRLTKDGYTKMGGSPTDIVVKIAGTPHNVWRRVYIRQISNSPSYFIKSKQYGNLFIRTSDLENLYR